MFYFRVVEGRLSLKSKEWNPYHSQLITRPHHKSAGFLVYETCLRELANLAGHIYTLHSISSNRQSQHQKPSILITTSRIRRVDAQPHYRQAHTTNKDSPLRLKSQPRGIHLYSQSPKHRQIKLSTMANSGYDVVVDVDDEGDLGHTDLTDLEFHPSSAPSLSPSVHSRLTMGRMGRLQSRSSKWKDTTERIKSVPFFPVYGSGSLAANNPHQTPVASSVPAHRTLGMATDRVKGFYGVWISTRSSSMWIRTK